MSNQDYFHGRRAGLERIDDFINTCMFFPHNHRLSAIQLADKIQKMIAEEIARNEDHCSQRQLFEAATS